MTEKSPVGKSEGETLMVDRKTVSINCPLREVVKKKKEI